MSEMSWVSVACVFGRFSYRDPSWPSVRFLPDTYVVSHCVSPDGSGCPARTHESATPGEIYTVSSDEELRDIRETFGWAEDCREELRLLEQPADAVYDTL